MGLTLTHISLAQTSNEPKSYVWAHNIVRAAVGVSPLTYNASAAASALKSAISRSRTCELYESDTFAYVYQILASGDEHFTIVNAVQSWAGGKPFYNHEKGTCFGGSCEEYMVLVTEAEKSVGCGISKCDNGNNIVVCEYSPRNVVNIPGRKPY